MMRSPTSQTLSIVAIGSFNPAIIQPKWMESHALAGEGDLKALQELGVQIISQRATQLRGSSFELLVLQNRLQCTSLSPDADEVARDAVVGIMRLLGHTPIESLGINHHAHWKLESTADVDRVLCKYAQTDAIVQLVGEDPHTGLVVRAPRPDRMEGRIIVSLEPSLRETPGVYLKLNDHAELHRWAPPITEGRQLPKLLEGELWSKSQALFHSLADKVFQS